MTEKAVVRTALWLLLAACMVFVACTFIVLDSDAYAVEEYRIVCLGHYETDGFAEEAEPIEWYVLDETDEDMLLLAAKSIECSEYAGTAGADWLDSIPCEMLNSEMFYSMFSEEEISRISRAAEHRDISGMSEVHTPMFLLSKEEVGKYFFGRGISAETGAATQVRYRIWDVDDGGCAGWWLRRSDGEMLYVDHTGNLARAGGVDGLCLGIRPAMWASK